MSEDMTTFIRWFGGEPVKIYTPEMYHQLFDSDGTINLDRAWIRIGLDYNHNPSIKRSNKQQHVTAPVKVNPLMIAMEEVETATNELTETLSNNQ